jgi:hypothetical protein
MFDRWRVRHVSDVPQPDSLNYKGLCACAAEPGHLSHLEATVHVPIPGAAEGEENGRTRFPSIKVSRALANRRPYRLPSPRITQRARAGVRLRTRGELAVELGDQGPVGGQDQDFTRASG